MHAARVADPTLTSGDETPKGPIAILAGSGALPIAVADRLAAQGREHRILAFRGFADRALRRRADAVVGLLDVRGAIACLEAWAPGAVTLAGGIARPNASAALDAFALVRGRQDVAALLARGDDHLLRGVLQLLEERGHRLVGSHELVPELLAKSGTYGAIEPSDQERAAAERGACLLADTSRYDVGQAVVIAGRRVLAIEGPEGTDRMLARVRALGRGWLRRTNPRGGVLVKAAKAEQDFRVDLPAIGPRTIRNAARAGLAGVAVAGGTTLVLEVDVTTALADSLGLFLIGMPPVRDPDR